MSTYQISIWDWPFNLGRKELGIQPLCVRSLWFLMSQLLILILISKSTPMAEHEHECVLRALQQCHYVGLNFKMTSGHQIKNCKICFNVTKADLDTNLKITNRGRTFKCLLGTSQVSLKSSRVRNYMLLLKAFKMINRQALKNAMHTSQNSFNKWTKISSLEIDIFDLKMMLKSGLEFFILKFTEPLQSCCCPVQKNLP